MRRLFLIPIVIAAAACQSNGGIPASDSSSVAAAAEHIATLPPEQSKPAVDRLANQVIAAQSEACGVEHDAAWQACMNVKLLASFDRYGFLIRHCGIMDSVKAFRDCVLYGRSGVDWLLAAGANPDTDFDWSKPEASHDLALKRLNDVLTERCEGEAEAPGDSCFTAESAKSLGLSEAVARGCAAHAELGQRGRCIVDAHDAAMYQAALMALER